MLRRQIGGRDVCGNGGRPTDNVIQGNYLGINAAGAAALGNVDSGVEMIFAPENTLIGGVVPGAGNLISGNLTSGLYYYLADGTKVEGNLIGTDATGTAGTW